MQPDLVSRLRAANMPEEAQEALALLEAAERGRQALKQLELIAALASSTAASVESHAWTNVGRGSLKKAVVTVLGGIVALIAAGMLYGMPMFVWWALGGPRPENW